MLEKMKALLRENSLCVLATCSEGRPHCSLMTYVTDEHFTDVFGPRANYACPKIEALSLRLPNPLARDSESRFGIRYKE